MSAVSDDKIHPTLLTPIAFEKILWLRRPTLAGSCRETFTRSCHPGALARNNGRGCVADPERSDVGGGYDPNQSFPDGEIQITSFEVTVWPESRLLE